MVITLNRIVFRALPVILTFLLLVVSLYFLSVTLENPQDSETLTNWLIPTNIAILLLLSGVIIVNLFRILRNLKTKQAGSRFTIRLMIGFVVLTLLPVTVVSFFSMNFLGKRIDAWFDIRIERALEDSLELGQRSLEIRMQQYLREMRRISLFLRNMPITKRHIFLDEQRERLAAHELILLGQNQRIIAASVEDAKVLIPHFPAEDLSRTLNHRRYYYHLEPVGKDGLYARVAVKFQFINPERRYEREFMILTALFPISERERSLASSVVNAQGEYKELKYQRNLLKDGFRLTLFLIMILTVLFSIWAAFVFSKRLTKPVRILIEATLAVAAGNLNKKLSVSNRDDFSLVSQSFNTMTTRLTEAKQEREQHQQQIKQQHDYLNAVLEHLNSGVLTLDDKFAINKVNSVASQILSTNLIPYIGVTLKKICDTSPELQPFLQAISPCFNKKQKEWQTEVTLFLNAKRQILVCRGARLPKREQQSQGYVIIFDDVTELIQAEHDAAWGEVARRLAHEIKNPLTPIQLSAERLAYKLSRELSPNGENFLKRMVATIVHQVDTMKTMVNAFSEYARTPKLVLQTVDLNQLITDVVALYRSNKQDTQIKLKLQEIPSLQLDSHKIRQLLINLLKNALEALISLEKKGRIIITTSLEGLPKTNIVQLTVTDNGTGIPENLLPQLFEPYISSKSKGSGLGLAIAKKIIEEHAGMIKANNTTEGAIITIRLPI